MRGRESRRWIPSRDSKNAIAWPAPRTQPASSTPSISSHSPVMPLMRCAAASSKTRPDTVDAQAIPSIKSAISCVPRVIGSRSVNKNDSAQPSRQMRRISVSKSPTTAPSKYARSSTKTHPPTADTWPLVSLSTYQRVPSPKSLAWAGPYASGRMPSWPTSTQPEPATHRTEAINEHYRTRQTHRQRLPQPHQPQTPNAPHRRRPRRLHPHSTLKSRIRSLKPSSSARCRKAQDDVRAHALHILPRPCAESHKCAVMMRIAARVCGAPADNPAVSSTRYQVICVCTDFDPIRLTNLPRSQLTHTPKTRPGLVPHRPGK